MAAAAVIVADGVAAAARTAGGDPLVVGSVLRVDALSAVMLIVIGSVGRGRDLGERQLRRCRARDR